MILKLLKQYLIATGLFAHVALLAMLILAPGLANKVKYKAAAKIASVLPAAEAAAPATWEQARGSLSTWQPATDAPLAKGRIRVDGHDVGSIKEAAGKLRNGSILEIGEGVYSTPLVTKASNIRVVGRGHVVFDGAVAAGKGTFLVQGNDTTIENIECRNVAVRDGNGACVRLEGANLNLEHVYFHSSQQGLLTGKKPGHVSVRNSYLERLGNRGRAHGVYQNGGTLSIDHSYILGAKNEGHEIKSRATKTSISHSVVASLTGKDSRLIDISNGGIVSITDNTLQQGANSQNWDMIGFALEKGRHAKNSLTVKRNVIILERPRGNKMLHSLAKGMTPDISDNIIVSPEKTGFGDTNLEYRSRKAAKLPAYPAVPERPS